MPPPFGISVDFLNAALGINEAYGPPLDPVPGPTGPNGATGGVGATGAAGVAGAVGATGVAGAVGATGVAGAVGATGATGVAGAVGATGAAGVAGVVGATGPAGATGADGAAGATGADGAPGPSIFSALYPFPTAIRTGTLTAATRVYLVTYTMTASTTLVNASTFFGTPGSDSYRVAVYRGDLSNATLVAQTTSVAATSTYNTKPFTVVSGQSLSFLVGSQITIGFAIAGGTATPAYFNSTSNGALATFAAANYTGGFPAAVTGITGQAATIIRICLELA